ncbi:MAG: LysR family transcriptional regulator [Serratia symbiotica]|nr:LysR family transcriptional regulator [Serratia symbiotica]
MEYMKAFRMVVECQGFRAAAIAMKISPAMVSRRIEKLEHELKIPLFKRNSRKVLLTTAGGQLYQRCVSIIDDYESCMRDVKSFNAEVGGCLKVGIPHSINHLHIIPNLRQFFEQYPQLRLETVTGNHCMELFSHGFDLALQCGPRPDSNLYYSLLGYWRKHACVAPDYVRRYGLPGHPDELQSHTCLFHFDNHCRSWKFMIEGELKEVRLSCTSRVSNSLDLYQMVKNGLGIVYLPDFTVRDGINSGKIVSVLDEFMPPPLPMYVVHVNPKPSPKEQAFIDFIRTLNLATVADPTS